ncbi:Ger(x)C family spore germination protein [Brevibacillus sp. NRS-1366]|uniref:Ger(x)C family spore germination protein n=1 Tax=Brevibacillus sp. NRS-1366 TaxID=3233899 RepID=UPI003D194D24
MRAGYVVLVFCGLVLGGCWDRTEINDLAIITAAAIDKEEDDEKHEIRLSIQVFNPRQLSSGQGGTVGGGGELTAVYSGTGVNISDAMSKVQAKLPRIIFWGHCKVFLFGEAAARGGMAEHIDFLIRHPGPRNRAYLYVTKGQAKEGLAIKTVLERSSAEGLRELASMHIGMAVTLVDFRNMLKSESEVITVPMIQEGGKLQSPTAIQTTPILIGSALFKKDKMIAHVSPKVTRGIMWLRDEVTHAAITVRPPHVKGDVSVIPSRSKVTLIPVIRNGKWTITVKVDTEGDVVENGTLLNLMNPDFIAIVQKAVRDDIQARIKFSLHTIQKELKVDVANFAGAFHRKYPKEWERAKNRWEKMYPNIEVKTQINVKIRRPGLISAPAGIPQDEVINK